MHRDPEEPCTPERDERAHAMRDGEPRERDLGIAFTGEQATARVADTIERSARNIRRRHDEQCALRAGNADVDAAATTRCVRDA